MHELCFLWWHLECDEQLEDLEPDIDFLWELHSELDCDLHDWVHDFDELYLSQHGFLHEGEHDFTEYDFPL